MLAMKWYSGRPSIVKTRVVQMVCCLFLTTYGLLMVLSPEKYTAPAYYQAFLIATARTWGIVFMATGVLGLGSLVGPRPATYRHEVEVFAGVCVFVRIFFMLFWTLLLLVSVTTQDNAGTLGGPLIWVALAAMDFSSVVRFGTGRADGG